MVRLRKGGRVLGKRSVEMLAVLGVVAAFVVAGCGGGGGGGEQGGGEGSGSPTATIVSDLPLQGSARARQETIANAITLALEERGYMAGDVQIEYVSQDDATAQAGKWDEARCAENAQSAAQDEQIVGWIGPYNSGCAAIEIPILNQAGLAMVSHGNTAVGLTKPSGEEGEPEQYYPTGERNYTRVIVTDDKQARAGAAWMRDEGIQSVYIIDDQETFGAGLADQFGQSAEAAGIQVLGREGIDGNAANYRPLMAQIAQLNPDAIYFAGITDNNAGQIAIDKVGAGMSNEDVMFMGSEGILEEAFIEAAGEAAEGSYLTFSGLPASELPGTGQEFVERYQERFPDSEVDALTAYGYEAANVLLDAIENAYNTDGEVTREGVLRELFATQNYDGVLGTWSFDENGDTTLTDLSGERVQDGQFEFSRTIDVGEG
jgi:branched-chain amino acid transport system substrate-binding protein